MKEKQDKIRNKSQPADELMLAMVKWTENGITHLGTVTDVYSVGGIKYLTVMTIFGKRCTVKKSKVKLQPQYLRA